MHYVDIVTGTFLRRLNRFVAEVEVNGGVSRVHVRNTGRCTAVIAPGAKVSLQRSSDPKRATPFTLIAVNTLQYGWVNLDSLAPNKMAGEWLKGQGYVNIRPEYRFGESRIDFYAERDGERYLIEVKGCTLERGGTGLFPDAPTSRGAKHLRELALAAEKGYRPVIAFVIMLNGITDVRPNADIDPDFAAEYEKAHNAGVETRYITCRCTPEDIFLT
ncbi:MAG: DNA/RNA nuclease SfsA [Oscillospiraceae bacterium]